MSDSLVVGITGASGAIYALRLLQLLVRGEQTIHLTISPAGKTVLATELGIEVDLDHFAVDQLRLGHDFVAMQTGSPVDETKMAQLDTLASAAEQRLRYYNYRDFMSPLASGSFLTRGMVICPCSGSTVSAVATGASSNLIHRAADVHLKERRPLILVPRETPLSMVHLDNMRRATEVGATVLPAMPGWYHGVKTIHDLVDFVVARILDQLGLRNAVMKRWGERCETED
jgi:4-hydroxy-3-polyprenylbenzoate decarboxylase